MNHIYRLCWNRATGQWVAASELATSAAPAPASRKRFIGHRAVMLSVLTASLFAAGAAYAGGPVGGQITSGAGQIQQLGNTTVIHQNSQTLTLNWQSFNIGANQTVDFLQPGSNSIAVNRIFSSTPSEIYGHLNANGQVWLINPNGILFGQGSQVNVGGLIASTMNLEDGTLSSNSRSFSGSGTGSIINKGTITAANGGYVALLGNQISNQGTISAQLGTVALGGGSAFTLTFSGNQLLHVQVDQSTLNNLVDNRQLIVANGGQVIMTAGAKNAILASAVNNTGVVQAQTVASHNGTITLLGGMTAGTVNVGGTLDASAPNGGNGGSIETSAAHFATIGNADITAAAPHGKAGQWLVDPVDLDINAQVASDIETSLNGGTSVTETTGASGNSGPGSSDPGASGGPNGDINVNAPITWTNANANLTLSAYNGINVNDAITGAGGLTLVANGSTNGAGIAINAAVSTNAASMQSLIGNMTLGAAGSIAGTKGVTLVTTANFINNAGSSAVTSSTGSWLIYSTNPANDTDGGLTPNFIQYSATSQTVPAGTGNGFLYTLIPTVALTGLTGAVDKVYDGTTAATLTSANFTTSGLLNGDVISGGTATGTYATANAGAGISVSATAANASFTFTNSTGTIAVYGYKLSGTATGAVGDIAQRQLTATIIGNPTKIYDGTTTATLTSANYSVTGFVGTQGVTVGQPQSVGYAGSSAGSETVDATFDSENFTASGGANLNNYILPVSASGLGTITQAPIFIRGLLADSKTYDGTTTATLSGTTSLYGVIGTDAVQLDSSGEAASFATANAGNGITVTASGFTLTGAQAGDYQLMTVNGLSANISPKAISISGISAGSRAYDGSDDATLLGTGQLNGLVATDINNVTLSSTNANGTFSQSNVGSNLAVSVSGYSLTGSAAGNYSLSQPSGLTGNITPAVLTIGLNTTPSKIYDDSNAANLSSSEFTISGFVTGQGATVTQSNASYNSANVAVANQITVDLQPSDLTPQAGTMLSNYTFAPSFTAPGVITPVLLGASIVGNPTKQYDGTTTATLGSTNYLLTGFVGSDGITVTQTSGTYASPTAGTEPVSATIDSSDYTAVGSTLLSNYVVPSTIAGFGTITPVAVTGTIIGAITGTLTKVYDGTDVAIIPAGDFVFSGFKNGDSASLNVTNITGAYATSNVGVQPISASIPSADFTFTSGNASDYTFPVMAYGTGQITPAMLQVTLSNLTKVYDGTANASVTSSDFQVTGFVPGQGATINPSTSYSYGGSNVGNYNVTGTLTPGNYVPTNGTLLSNYTLVTSVQGLGTITPAPLFITDVYASNKTYDTTNADTLNVGSAGLAGLVSSDVGQVALTSATTGTFSQSNVGNGLTVTPGTFSISGSQAANYTLMQPTGLTANITPAPLTVSGITANDKTYDGTTAATFNSTNYVLSGIFASDDGDVSMSSTNASGTFRSANVGTNLAVTATGFGLTGSAASNYSLVQPTGLTASISPAQLLASITGDPTKAYDGSTSATLSASDYTLTINGGQVVTDITVPQSATASYQNANAGTEVVTSTLVSSDFLASNGDNLSNYILPTGATGNGTINPKIINISATRAYNGTTTALASLFGTYTGIGSDRLILSGSGAASAKDPGTYTNTSGLDVSGLTLMAASGNAATASNYTLVGGTDTFIITPLVLNLTGTRVYNQTAIADGALFGTLTGVGADTLTVSGTATSNSKNVGTYTRGGGSLNIGGLTLVATGSANAADYTLVGGADTFSITPLLITLDASGINKIYDSTDSATVNLSVASTGSQVYAGDVINFSAGSALFTNPNVANGIAVNVSGITATGADAGNYTFNTTAATTADITPRPLNLTGTRIYDGTSNADGSVLGTVSGLNGDSFTVSGVGVLSGRDVGTYTQSNPSLNFGLGNLQLVAINGNANNYTLVGGTDSFTISSVILNLSGTRVYDASTDADGSLFGTLSGVGGETLTVTGSGTTSSKNVGTYTQGTPNNLSVTGLTLVGGSGTDAADYTLVGGTDSFIITPLTITANASALNKVYDATNQATVTLSSGGVLGTDQISFADTSSTFATPNAGTGITVTASGISLGGADAGNYVLSSSTATTSADITPALIALNSTRVYDGSTGADASLFTTGGQITTGVAGQTLSLTGSGVLDSKDVGTEGFQSIGTLALGNGTGLNGGSASNYIFAPLANDSVAITPLAITVSATAENKVYDGTTDVTLSSLGSAGVIAGDNINFADTTQAFANANAANGVQVNVSGITATGTDIGNYTFNTSTTTSANITPLSIVLTSTRVYDGGTDADASLFTTGGLLATGIGNQTLNLSGSGVLVTKNVGSEQAFQSLGTLQIANGTNGGLSSNYTLSPISSDWVTITPLAITVTATGNNKTYDGNTTATVGLGSSGILAGDQVSFADGSANFSSPNAANGISIAVSGISDSGADAGNYIFNTSATTSANITPVVINLSGTRVYDANTDANASLFGNNGVVAGINGQTLDLTGTGVLVSKNVSPSQPFASLGTLQLNNGTGLASNYTLIGGVDQVAITPAILMVTGTTTTNRVYDGTTLDTLNGSTLVGVLGNDNVTLGNDSTGTFNNKNVGNNKPVSTAMTVSGSDASNYILEQPTGLVANITPLQITVAALGTSRPYNGLSTDSVTLSSTGVLSGDQIGFAYSSALFNNPYVGNNKPVTVSGISLTGSDAGNYLVNPVAMTEANITSVGYAGTGIDGGWIAQLQSTLYPQAIATPYGSAEMDTVGVYIGNHKLQHKPIERNRIRSDFHSGFPLQVNGEGVHLPLDASP